MRNYPTIKAHLRKSTLQLIQHYCQKPSCFVKDKIMSDKDARYTCRNMKARVDKEISPFITCPINTRHTDLFSTIVKCLYYYLTA